MGVRFRASYGVLLALFLTAGLTECLTCITAIATEPVNSISAFEAPEPEEIVRVRPENTKIGLVDFELLRQDFPFLRTKSKNQIREWLRGMAIVARTQADQTLVNTPLVTEPVPSGIAAVRPKDFGRALMISVKDGDQTYWINSKGCGTRKPAFDRNGLLSAAEAYREFIIEKLVHKALIHSGKIDEYDTEGIYAVIWLGADMKYDSGGQLPVALVLRQPIERNRTPFALWDVANTKKIELLLRRYGMTTAGAHRYIGHWGGQRDRPYDLLNAQGGRDKSGKKIIADFGAMLVVKDGDFYKPGYSIQQWLEHDEPVDLPSDMPVIIDPKNAEDQVKPGAFRFPFELLGYENWERPDPTNDRLTSFFYGYAESKRGSALTPLEEVSLWRRFLRPVEKLLGKLGCGSLLSPSKKP